VVFGAPINATLNQTRNVGDGHYYGTELSASTQLLDAFKIGGNYTYLQRRLTDPTNAAFHPTGVPTHKLFTYADWRIANNLTITPSVEWESNRWTVTSSDHHASALLPHRCLHAGQSCRQLDLQRTFRCTIGRPQSAGSNLSAGGRFPRTGAELLPQHACTLLIHCGSFERSMS
jgi:hypothetical protein